MFSPSAHEQKMSSHDLNGATPFSTISKYIFPFLIGIISIRLSHMYLIVLWISVDSGTAGPKFSPVCGSDLHGPVNFFFNFCKNIRTEKILTKLKSENSTSENMKVDGGGRKWTITGLVHRFSNPPWQGRPVFVKRVF